MNFHYAANENMKKVWKRVPAPEWKKGMFSTPTVPLVFAWLSDDARRHYDA